MSSFWQREGIVFKDKRTAPMAFRDAPAAAAFLPFVESFWWMTWDLGDEVVPTDIVPSGCFNLIVEEAVGFDVGLTAKVVGPRKTSATQRLSGRGRRFGIRFYPGGFTGVFGGAADAWCDGGKALASVVGAADAAALAQAVLASAACDAALNVLRAWLAPRLPAAVEPRVDLAVRACRTIASHQAIVGIAELCSELGVDESTLQRAFRAVVGLSPKRMLRTKRFQEAVTSVLAGNDVPWVDFALNLGYYDQAHFVRDFHALTGRTPTSLSPSAATMPEISNKSPTPGC